MPNVNKPSLDEIFGADAPEGGKPSLDQIFGDKVSNQDVPASPPPSQGEAALRGVGQGASLGFADEIAGALSGSAWGGVKAAFGHNDADPDVKAYIAARDKYRQGDAAAQGEFPKTYTAGQVGGGIATAFVPGLNLGKAATVGGRLLRAGTMGGAVGLGNSKAELSQGQSADAAYDAGKGALISSAFQGAGEALMGAKPLAQRFAANHYGMDHSPLSLETAGDALKSGELTFGQKSANAPSFTSKMIDMATGIGGYHGLSSGNPKEVALAVAMGVGRAATHGRGNSMAAATLNGISKVGQGVQKSLDANTIIQTLKQVPGAAKFAGAIQQAATRGQGSLAMTHFLLSTTEPEYQAATRDGQ